ncbi:MAG TPA: fasciclin domain-containing protein [Acidobacteriota bacterium]|nr:fasciclin domain-containing protein [Acidobacteriota bacterium]
MRSFIARFTAPAAFAVAAALLLGSLFVAPSLANAAPAKNIVQTAKDAGQFGTLLAALKATDLIGTLSGQGQGPFTVFAPTDAAFAKLPAGTLESLLADPAALKSILLYHVVAGELTAADVTSRAMIATVNGQPLAVSTTDGAKVNDATITSVDIRARNGIIHVIDTVLLPR